MVGLLARRAEQHVQRIADDLGHRAVMGEHDVGHAGEIVIEQRLRARSGSSVSTSAVKLAMSVNSVAISRRCPPRSTASASPASRSARLGEK